MAKVRLPTPLRPYAGNQSIVEVDGANVGEVLARLVARHEGLRGHLFDDRGRLRAFVNVYVNQEDVRTRENDATPVAAGDVVMIVPAVAGGATGAGSLSRDELSYYARHLIMPEVGLKGQERLKRAKVLVVGTGGLGAPTSLYLAAAGVGRIGLVDFDRVEASNLHRQVLFSAADVGRPKVEAAAARLRALNPHIDVDTYDTTFTSANALDILGEYDVLVDGTDNFPTRYLSNDAAVLSGKPNVYASIFRFEGQASVFGARDGPCYRCLYPAPPPPGLVPSCAEGGVLGVLPGVMGTIQAVETVKQILGTGQTLAGRLLLFDALAMEFTSLNLRKNPDCPACGAKPTLKGLVDYEEFCGVPHHEDAIPAGVPTIAARELHARREAKADLTLVDVREPHEWEIGRIAGALHVPLGDVVARAAEIPQTGEVVLYCRSGSRSARATEALRGLGFRNVKNLEGGILAWARDVDPSVPAF